MNRCEKRTSFAPAAVLVCDSAGSRPRSDPQSSCLRTSKFAVGGGLLLAKFEGIGGPQTSSRLLFLHLLGSWLGAAEEKGRGLAVASSDRKSSCGRNEHGGDSEHCSQDRQYGGGIHGGISYLSDRSGCLYRNLIDVRFH